MTKNILAVAAFLTVFMAGCSDKHLISDKDYRLKVGRDFEERRSLAVHRDSVLFSVLNSNLPLRLEEALRFLYAYMPLSDLADYNGSFFLDNAEASLKARDQSSWGKEIPDDIFLHYVLPLRVNNENLDSFRLAYYEEIYSRIKGLDAAKAALEVNHWCQEKVAYQPADIRTSGPMSTILSARGRCGEESTFTVAALRAVSLPARQVYTPRWAHSDDNHAWVEVWIDGKWYYMGACEPEPVLDRGWFTRPATRAMLVHTKSFGAPSGEENTMLEERNFAVINNLGKYAKTKKIFIRVNGPDDEPVEEACVEYQLYNYAEFYPLAVLRTDENGMSSFETGFGDLMIWARKGDKFDYRKISVPLTDTITLTLSNIADHEQYHEYDLGVPEGEELTGEISGELIRLNNERLEAGNRIRQAYIDSWMKPEEALELARSAGADPVKTGDIIEKSMGNYKAIASFIMNAGKENTDIAIKLLSLISDKDIRDTPEPVLMDHLVNSIPFDKKNDKVDEKVFDKYVLNPRIDNELITPWRGYLLENACPELPANAQSDPLIVAEYVNNRVSLNEQDNYYQTPISPPGVHQLRIADRQSRNIYFIALCRTLGIPARLEDGTRRVQAYSNNRWNEIFFEGEEKPSSERGTISLLSKTSNPVPEYYIHFTLARFGNGRYNTLEYDYNRKITEFGDRIEILPGNYMLVTGNRISDSKILASVSFFRLNGSEHETINADLRKDATPSGIIGKFDGNLSVITRNGERKLLSGLWDKGIVLVWIEPETEPARHIFNDILPYKNELDRWGGCFVFLFDPAGPSGNFSPDRIEGLPENTFFSADKGLDLLKYATGILSSPDAALPLVLVLNSSGEITWKSEGYRVGAGEQILKRVR